MKQVRLCLRCSACVAVVSSMLAVPAVFAQDAPAAPPERRPGVEEIMVTARRRDENRCRTCRSPCRRSRQSDIENTGAQDITWLQQTTPNLTLQVARGTNSTLIAFIRGVGQQDPLWGFEPGVGLYVDDVYIARPQGAVLDIYDIERLEVLRGPQGTLYGRNTSRRRDQVRDRSRSAEDARARRPSAQSGFVRPDTT